ncbi:MAG: lipocalin family protein [Myxococcota bacterium]
MLRLSMVLGLLLFAVPAVAGPVRTVPTVDLGRYVGKWYEIASYPQRFTRKCVRDISATYSKGKGGRIDVVNRCTTKDGELKVAEGYANVIEGTGNAKLEVTFFWPFFGDYWVIGLDPQYRYAVVGDPDREYLWILSRTPQLPQDLLDAALAAVRAQGFDAKRLRWAVHTVK